MKSCLSSPLLATTYQPIAPTVPAVAGGAKLEVNAVELPLLAYYPDLRDVMVQAQIDQQASELKAAETELAGARAELQNAQQTLESHSSVNKPIIKFC